MSEYYAVSPAAATFLVTFRDGSSTEVEAKEVHTDEHGAAFLGRKSEQQGKGLVAFIPYGDLRMIQVLPQSKVQKRKKASS
ncbi:hypothetical protein [Streptomyces sp. NPDC018045]|uniref:hypothetical protein n=1 Tax=Streptomyces sp. NPDC018045 TaxID=3365037 RepID=UPI0037AFF079